MTANLLSLLCVWGVQISSDLECICGSLCHQLVPPGPGGCDKSQSGCLKSSSLGDGWPLAWCMAAAVFPQACERVVFGQVTSASCASHRVPGAPMCCLGVNIIHGPTWQRLSDGAHCLWDGNQILPGLFFSSPFVLRHTLSSVESGLTVLIFVQRVIRVSVKD